MFNKRTGIILTGLLMLGVAYIPVKNYICSYPCMLSETEAMVEGEENEENEAAEWAGRNEYFQLMRGKADPDQVKKVTWEVENFKSGNYALNKVGDTLNWKEMGPDNMGGRTLAILVDKDDPNTLYAGSASGGIWKTLNSGANWFRLGGRDLKNLAVGSIAQAGNGDLFFGTGELYSGSYGGSGQGSPSTIGRGVYFSTDKGVSFTQVAKTDPANPYTKTSAFDYIPSLAQDPQDADRIFVGTKNGLKLISKVNGAYAVSDITAPGNGACTDIKFSADGNTIFTVMSNFGFPPSANIWRGTGRDGNGAYTWKRVDNGGGANGVATASGSTKIAVAASDPNIIYASVVNTANRMDGLYRSGDQGNNWSKVVAGGSSFSDPFITNTASTNPQGYYDHAVAVDPSNAERVFVAGIYLFKAEKPSTGGAYQFDRMSSYNYDESNPSSFYNRFYVHPDLHVLTIDKTSKPNILYIGSDGGVYKTSSIFSSSTPTFQEVNNGYATIQFYALAVSFVNADVIFGGTQDNGTLQVSRNGSSFKNGRSIKGGDGGYAAASAIDPRIMFAESQSGAVQRTLDGKTFSSFLPDAVSGIKGWSFITPYRLWENLKPDTLMIKDKREACIFAITGPDGIYATHQGLRMDLSPVFKKIAAFGNGGSATHMEFAPDGKVLYASVDGTVYRVSGLDSFYKFMIYTGTTRTAADFGISQSIIYSTGRSVTGIGVDPNDPNHVVLTLGDYLSSSTHVLMSNNATATTPTFADISGNLPGFPCYDAEIDKFDSKHIVLATEFGIWSTFTSGSSWFEDNRGEMQRVPSLQLKQMQFADHKAGGSVFYVATHGRGFLRADNLSTVGIEKKEMPGIIEGSFSVYPNPAREYTKVALSLERPSGVRITVMDLQGKVVENLDCGRKPAGDMETTINTSSYKNGTYIIRVCGQGFEKTSKILVMN